jgi:hypothetical protein
MDTYTFDYLLHVSGGAFLLACLIGALCLVKYLVGEVSRWRGMSLRGLLIGGWKPGDFGFHRWTPDWWWANDS